MRPILCLVELDSDGAHAPCSVWGMQNQMSHWLHVPHESPSIFQPTLLSKADFGFQCAHDDEREEWKFAECGQRRQFGKWEGRNVKSLLSGGREGGLSHEKGRTCHCHGFHQPPPQKGIHDPHFSVLKMEGLRNPHFTRKSGLSECLLQLEWQVCHLPLPPVSLGAEQTFKLPLDCAQILKRTRWNVSFALH